MNIKLIGAMCVIIGCGGVGFRMASEHIPHEKVLRELITVLDYMECELSYRLTQLPQLCRQASQQGKGVIFNLFQEISEELENQISPDAEQCVLAAVAHTERVPDTVKELVKQLGRGMGCFDLDGQLQTLRAVREGSEHSLKLFLSNRDSRLRGYQTLGLCAGAAIVILFI